MTKDFAIKTLIVVGFLLVSASGIFRLTSMRQLMTDANNDRWRFSFFIFWVLSLPLALLVEYHFPNSIRPKPPHPLTLDFTYARKVISDVGAAVAVVLAALAWNTKP